MNRKMLMGTHLEDRNKEAENFFFGNPATSSQSAFVNDNIFHGKFFIDTAITAESANTFVQNLKWFSNYQLQLSPERRKPAVIFINTPGGSVYQGWAIINAIRSCPLKTIGIIQGHAMSMGVPILLSCNERIGYEYSTVMIHQVASATWGKVEDMILDVEETKRTQKRLEKFIMDHSDVKQEFLDNLREKKMDVFLYPDEALEMGIIDDIIGDWSEYEEKMQAEMMEMFGGAPKGKGCGCGGNCDESDTDEADTKGYNDGVALEDEDEDEIVLTEVSEDNKKEVPSSKTLQNKKRRLKSKIKKIEKQLEGDLEQEEREILFDKLIELEEKLEAVLNEIKESK